MGNYTTDAFIELFGGLPERDDRNWAGPELREDDDTKALTKVSASAKMPRAGTNDSRMRRTNAA